MVRRFAGADEPDEAPRDAAFGAVGGETPGEAIDRAIHHLEAGRDSFAIFAADEARNTYVQVYSEGQALEGEAVGNDYLADEARLDEDGHATLVTLGWDLAEPGAGNHSRTWRDWRGAARPQVVEDVLSTLVLVYEMAPGAPLAVRTGT
jgi:hypothetical protein